MNESYRNCNDLKKESKKQIALILNNECVLFLTTFLIVRGNPNDKTVFKTNHLESVVVISSPSKTTNCSLPLPIQPT